MKLTTPVEIKPLGLQYKEIAEELGMELNTVRTRIRRAKAMIEDLKAGED